MSRNGKVIVAMSGGVDSSVAACLLKEQGYDCIGVFLRVGDQAAAPISEPPPSDTALPMLEAPRRLKHGCCSMTDALDARAVAGKLGIPFYALNFQADFSQIVEYFVDEYARARTPNPCVMCNVHLKFGKLLRYADMMDAEFIATGHYARIVRAGSSACLARGANAAKDQSYVLFGIERGALPRCLFPIGDIDDKSIVRQLAATLDLRVHDKPDSQEICFVPDNDYTRLVRERRPETLRPGPIVDEHGAQVGEHAGVANFTIGQRRGLGVALGSPRYVARLDLERNTVTLGPREALLSTGLVARQINWLTDPPPFDAVTPAAIKIRHMHTPAPGAFARKADGSVAVSFDEPQLAVTPGQAAVWYRDDGVVLGGGWIESPVDPETPAAP